MSVRAKALTPWNTLLVQWPVRCSNSFSGTHWVRGRNWLAPCACEKRSCHGLVAFCFEWIRRQRQWACPWLFFLRWINGTWPLPPYGHLGDRCQRALPPSHLPPPRFVFSLRWLPRAIIEPWTNFLRSGASTLYFLRNSAWAPGPCDDSPNESMHRKVRTVSLPDVPAMSFKFPCHTADATPSSVLGSGCKLQ